MALPPLTSRPLQRFSRATGGSLSRSYLAVLVTASVVFGLTVLVAPAASAAGCTGNEIVCENQLPGTPKSQWDIDGSGDDSIQGFATSMNRVVSSTPLSGSTSVPATTTITALCLSGLFNDGDVPTVVTANDPNSAELGTAFTADTPGLLTGVRFYTGL